MTDATIVSYPQPGAPRTFTDRDLISGELISVNIDCAFSHVRGTAQSLRKYRKQESMATRDPETEGKTGGKQEPSDSPSRQSCFIAR